MLACPRLEIIGLFLSPASARARRVERRRILFRSMTSSVSILSDFVAKGHQTLQNVSSSPSKIPYVWFSPVRLQTGIQLEPSSDHQSLSTGPAFPLRFPTYIQSQSHYLFFCGPFRHVWRRSDTEQSSPEALGSPTGYVVRPDLSLLWPHPKLSTPSIDLCIIRWGFALRPGMGWGREAPQFTLYILSRRAASCTPVDREGAFDCCFPSRVSLRHL